MAWHHRYFSWPLTTSTHINVAFSLRTWTFFFFFFSKAAVFVDAWQARTRLWRWACRGAPRTRPAAASWSRCWPRARSRRENGKPWSCCRAPRIPTYSMSECLRASIAEEGPLGAFGKFSIELRDLKNFWWETFQTVPLLNFHLVHVKKRPDEIW